MAFKWCPNGCGKSIVFDRVAMKFYCFRCEKHFEKELIEQTK